MKHKKHETGVVLYSGGLESTVAAFIAKQECKQVELLHIKYGQLAVETNLAMLNGPRDIGIQPTVLDIRNIYPSAVVKAAFGHSEQDDDGDPTYIPLRNPLFMLVAYIKWPEAQLYTGISSYGPWVHPDATESSIKSFIRAVNVCLPEEAPAFRASHPVAGLGKESLMAVIMATKNKRLINATIKNTTSCMSNENIAKQEPYGVACNSCINCKRRASLYASAKKNMINLFGDIMYQKQYNELYRRLLLCP